VWQIRDMNKRFAVLSGLIAVGCLLGVAADTKSARDLEFSRFSIRRHDDGTLARGKLKKPQTIDGFQCRRWVHFHANGKVKQLLLAKPAVVQGVSVPADATVFLTGAGKLKTIWFAKDTTVQGDTVRGGGKISKGFHENGALASGFLRKPAVIDDVPCKASVFKPVFFHPNGKLKEATLDRDATIQGAPREKGDTVRFDASGKLLSRNHQ